MQEKIYEKIVAILVNEFEINEQNIHLDANLFTDLKLDSLDTIDLMVTLDKELGIEIKTEEMKDIRTVKDVCDFVMTITK